MSMWGLVRHLDTKTFAPYLLFGDGDDVFSEAQQLGYSSTVISRSGWRRALLKTKVKRLLRRNQIDLVYVNCALTYSRLVAEAAHSLGVPIVWHVRENPFSNRVKKQLSAINCFADQLVVVSKEQLDALSGLSVPIRHVANGVDVSAFKPTNEPAQLEDIRRQYGLSENSLVYSIVGTIEPRKRTLLFAQAAAKVARVVPNSEFLIVGSGSDEDVTEVKRFTEQCTDLKGRVHFTGRISDIPGVFSVSDVFVMPSRWEGFPRSLIEAMAAGVASIATPVGDVPYIVEHGRDGLVVPVDEVEDMINAMQALAEDRDLRLELGQQARRKVESRYTWKVHMDAMEEVFNAALKPGEA